MDRHKLDFLHFNSIGHQHAVSTHTFFLCSSSIARCLHTCFDFSPCFHACSSYYIVSRSSMLTLPSHKQYNKNQVLTSFSSL
jgi:hypothetical protein